MSNPNYSEYPGWKLEEEAILLKTNLDSINYGPERHEQMRVRLGLIALEFMCRHWENKDLDPTEEIKGKSVDYYGFHAEAKGPTLSPVTEIGSGDN